MTPKEAWIGIKPNVSHFRIFGSHAWTHIMKSWSKDLDKKSRPLIFVVYYKDVKAYHLLYPTTHDLFFKKDVRFDEHLYNSPSSSSTSDDSHSPLIDVDDIPITISSSTDVDPPSHVVTPLINAPPPLPPPLPRWN